MRLTVVARELLDEVAVDQDRREGCSRHVATSTRSRMLEKYIRKPSLLARLRGSGLARELEALVQYLERRGHRRHAIRGYLLGAAQLADCIEKGLLPLDGLTADRLQMFARTRATRRECGCPRVMPNRNLISVARHFFAVLRDLGRVSAPSATEPANSPVDVLLTEFDRFLLAERGLAAATRVSYGRDLRFVLAIKFGHGAVDLSTITVQEIRGLVASRAATTSPRTARHLTVALRALFRFLMMRGDHVGHLLMAVPTPRDPRLSGPPRSLSEEQLLRLTRSIDVSKPIGLRARAVIECAATLGLRAGEIAALRVTDIDWREGTIRLPATKSRRVQVLPLPHAVGKAMAAYLRRGRPKSSTDHVFVRHYLPVGAALQSADITGTVRRAMRAAGLQLYSIGAHALRHTLATRLVQAGVGMKDIADIMRHRDIDTTRLYANVDWPRLAEVALPWPSGAR